MSVLSFTFRPELIPAYAQPEFLTRVVQLVMDYQALIAPVSMLDAKAQQAPPAESLPHPSAFVPVDGDESPPVEAPKKVRKNHWANLTEMQRQERIAAMKRGRDLKKAERRLSADSLEHAAPAPAPSPAAAAPSEDAVSETSSTKKQRKNPWADLTPEQKSMRIAKMQAARKAKKEAAAASV